MLLSKRDFESFFQLNCFSFFRKAEFALQKVEMQELTAKGMVFDRFPVAYGKKYSNVYFKIKFVFFSYFIKASGYGFGVISGTFAIANVLSDMIGPGTMGIFGHSPDFFIATGKKKHRVNKNERKSAFYYSL